MFVRECGTTIDTVTEIREVFLVIYGEGVFRRTQIRSFVKLQHVGTAVTSLGSSQHHIALPGNSQCGRNERANTHTLRLGP